LISDCFQRHAPGAQQRGFRAGAMQSWRYRAGAETGDTG
jgi:hypothetical protein